MAGWIGISKQLWQEFRIDEDFDAASGGRLPSDEACAFERQHHLVNRRRCDAKILLDVGFRRRPAMQARVQVDIRQVLALRGRKGFCGRTRRPRRAPTPGTPFSLSSSRIQPSLASAVPYPL